MSSTFVKDLDSLIDSVDLIDSGKIHITVVKPRRKSLRKRLAIKEPVFTLCLLAKCRDIKDCWDIKTLKWLGVRNPLCPRVERIKKINSLGRTYSYTLVKRGKSIADFSELEISILILAVRNLIESSDVRKTNAKQILAKLEMCSRILGYLS